MYVAAKKMQAHGPDGQPVTYLVGDALPHFVSWPHHIRRSMLEQHWVEFAHVPVVVPETVVVTPQVVVETPVETVMTQEVDAGLDVAEETPDAFACNECERTFKDNRGLNVHKWQAHKPAAV